jgi:hypothetical protein
MNEMLRRTVERNKDGKMRNKEEAKTPIISNLMMEKSKNQQSNDFWKPHGVSETGANCQDWQVQSKISSDPIGPSVSSVIDLRCSQVNKTVFQDYRARCEQLRIRNLSKRHHQSSIQRHSRPYRD